MKELAKSLLPVICKTCKVKDRDCSNLNTSYIEKCLRTQFTSEQLNLLHRVYIDKISKVKIAMELNTSKQYLETKLRGYISYIRECICCNNELHKLFNMSYLNPNRSMDACCYNAIKRRNISKVYEISQLSIHDIINMRAIGKVRALYIIECMRRFGYEAWASQAYIDINNKKGKNVNVRRY